MRTTGIGGSLFLVAIGAVLYFAVSADAEGIDLDMVGLILMIVGVVGMLFTLMMTASSESKESDVTVVER